MFVLKYTDSDDHFVALDSASGGYPFRVPINRAEIWLTRKSAQRYADMGKGDLKVMHLEYVVTDI